MTKSKVVWNSANPKLDFHKQFTVKKVTQELLGFLGSHAMVVEIWGTQGQLVFSIKERNMHQSVYYVQSWDVGVDLKTLDQTHDPWFTRQYFILWAMGV